MPRIRWRVFTKGLWAMGARDAQPEGTLRRASGIAPVKTTALRSRWGSSVLFQRTAHSLYRFNDSRFLGTSGLFYRENSLLHAGLNGGRLAFLRMPPTIQKTDFLFVAGGGRLFKVKDDGQTSLWGIAAPLDGFTATLSTLETRTIDRMELASSWTAASATLADEATIKQEGTQSMKMTVVANTVGTATKSITVDLTTYPTTNTVSPDEDFIECWVRVDNPSNLDQLQFAFDVSSGGVASFSTDFYIRTVVASDEFSASGEMSTAVIGVGDIPKITNNEPEFIFTFTTNSTEGGTEREEQVFPNPNFISKAEQIAIAERMGQTTIPVAVGTWVKLRLPKTTFTRSGGGTGTWANVRAVQLTAKTNSRGTAITYFDDLRLGGGVGMQGRYRYLLTFRNSTTGSRSNPNSTYVEVLNVARQPVVLASLPATTDPQVDQIEVWRTVGGGVRYFLDDRVAISAASYVDRTADYVGLHGSATTLLQPIELPLDNDPPANTYGHTWGPHLARAWWCRLSDTGFKGRVAFSPIGRPESVEDFLDVTNDDDPTQTGVTWNGSNWVFTESGIFEIAGTGPFLSRRVFGAPGTVEPFTVVPTPYGIAYLAADGVRLFNGVQSALVGFDAIGLVFRGEGLDGLAAFS